MLISQIKRINIAYLYHQNDRLILEALRKQLAGLCRNKIIYELEEPHAGTDDDQTESRLREAQIIIIFISSEFDADEYLSGAKMQLFVKECAKNGSNIWPIIAKTMHWDASSFREYEVFWGKEKSITSHTPQDDAFRRLIPKIRHEIDHIHSEAWLQYGDMCCHQMELEEALSAYENGRHHTPNYLPALLGKGRLFRKWNKPEEAKQYFDTIVSHSSEVQQNKKDASYSDTQRANLINACCKGYALLELGQLDEALVAFQNVHQQNASSMNSMQRNFYAQAYCGEGDTYLKIGNQSIFNFTIYYKAKALEAYKKAKDLALDDAKYLNKIGDIHILLAGLSIPNYSYEQAIDIYKDINERFHDYALAHVGRGNALQSLKRHTEALAAYEEALRYDQYEASGHGGKGEILLAQDKPQEALPAFEEALRLDNNNAEYYYGKGRTLAKLSRHQEALNAYDKACDCGCKSPSLWVHKANSLLQLAEVEQTWGSKAQAGLYYVEAQEYYTNARRQVWSEKDIVFCGLGKIALAYYHDWNQASWYYQKAINFAPNKANVYLEIGKMYLESQDHSEACKYFKYARSCCDLPNSTIDEADIQVACGDTYYRIAGKPDSKNYYENQKSARVYYEKALQIREKHVMAYVGLGKTCTALHYNKEAIDAFKSALSLNPQLIECYFFQAKCSYELEKFEEAYTLYEIARTHGMQNAIFHNAIGDTLLAMKRYFHALHVFNQVIEDIKEAITEELAHAYCGQGIALHALKNCEEALQCFEEAHKLDNKICLKAQYISTIQNISSFFEGRSRANPEDISAYKRKGDVLLLLGERINDAIDAYTKAIAHGDRSADVYFCRGEAYYRQHECHKSLSDYKTALAIDPNYQPAQQGEKKVKIMIEQHFEHPIQKFAVWIKTRINPSI